MRAAEGKGTCWRVEEAGKRFCWGEQRLACNGREATCWRMMYNDEGQKAIRSRPLQRFTAARRLLRPEPDLGVGW